MWVLYVKKNVPYFILLHNNHNNKDELIDDDLVSHDNDDVSGRWSHEDYRKR